MYIMTGEKKMASKMYNIVRILRVARPNRISKYYTNKDIQSIYRNFLMLKHTI